MKTLSFYALLVAAVAGLGGWYFYVYRESLVTQVEEPAKVAGPSPAAATSQRDDELAKRRQEGIGSIRDLKAVPLGAGNANGTSH